MKFGYFHLRSHDKVLNALEQKLALGTVIMPASLLVLPEVVDIEASYYSPSTHGWRNASHGRFQNYFHQLSRLSKEYGISMVVGLRELWGHRSYNSAFLFDGKQTVCLHRKVDCHEECFIRAKSLKDENPIDLDGCKIGCLIYLDINNPILRRRLLDRNPNVITIPAASGTLRLLQDGGPASGQEWMVGHFVIFSNSDGRSWITDSEGNEAVHSTDDRNKLVVCDSDAGKVLIEV